MEIETKIKGLKVKTQTQKLNRSTFRFKGKSFLAIGYSQ